LGDISYPMVMRSLIVACLFGLSGLASAKPYRPPPKRADASELTARLAEAIRNRDVAGVQAMLTDPLTHDGLWFADAACAKRFGTKGTIEKADVRVLARCLAQHKLVATTRKTVLANAGVLTFAPGVEIEVVFKNDRVIYAGGVWQREADRGTPTLTAQTFEALRVAGTTQLDAALAEKLVGSASAWIKTCLDKSGAIASTTVAEAKPSSAGAIFVAAIADWKFKPFAKGRACAMSLLTYPASIAPAVEVLPRGPGVPIADTIGITAQFDDIDIYDFSGVSIGSRPLNVPPTLLERNRIRGSKQIDPDPRTKTEINKSGKSIVLASLKLCLDAAGKVTTVSQLRSSGFRDYDAKLAREMRRWAFKPYQVRGAAAPVCTAITFSYRPKP
jgi:TonB family protein